MTADGLHKGDYQRGRRRLLEIVEALRPLGLTAAAADVAKALEPLCRGRRYAIRLNATMLRAIVDEARHQAIINRVVHDGMKRDGYHSRYLDFYPDYLHACELAGIAPVKPRTFQNRALQKQLWWERQPAYKGKRLHHDDHPSR